ncbi:AlpA family transcriptional regulator [Rhodococcus sp. BP-241]|uniref:helix-turn-helix transcriptional regulator n=1 Tax=Rhodococcus sp. BP-241 TaxID=2739441 RepID=UPI0021BE6034|nr:helix-turn-helix domain-containing protein [Rhodococcus sp. BP-241]
MEISSDYWLTRPEVAERLRIANKTIAMWACQGTGPKFAKFNGRARYRMSDVIAWENAQFGDQPGAA